MPAQRILIVTDAWSPQTNGVVSTLKQTVQWLGRFGHDVEVVSPEGQASLPCPTYPEIRLTMRPRRHVRERLRAFDPQALHIATEGPLGFAARTMARGKGGLSPPRITRSSRSTCASVSRFQCAGPMRPCAGSTTRRNAAW